MRGSVACWSVAGLLCAACVASHPLAATIILPSLTTVVDIPTQNATGVAAQASILTIQLGGSAAAENEQPGQRTTTTTLTTRQAAASQGEVRSTLQKGISAASDEAVTVVGANGQLLTIGNTSKKAAGVETKKIAVAGAEATVTVTVTAQPEASKKQKQAPPAITTVLVTVIEPKESRSAAQKQKQGGAEVTVTRTTTIARAAQAHEPSGSATAIAAQNSGIAEDSGAGRSSSSAIKTVADALQSGAPASTPFLGAIPFKITGSNNVTVDSRDTLSLLTPLEACPGVVFALESYPDSDGKAALLSASVDGRPLEFLQPDSKPGPSSFWFSSERQATDQTIDSLVFNFAVKAPVQGNATVTVAAKPCSTVIVS